MYDPDSNNIDKTEPAVIWVKRQIFSRHLDLESQPITLRDT